MITKEQVNTFLDFKEDLEVAVERAIKLQNELISDVKPMEMMGMPWLRGTLIFKDAGVEIQHDPYTEESNPWLFNRGHTFHSSHIPWAALYDDTYQEFIAGWCNSIRYRSESLVQKFAEQQLEADKRDFRRLKNKLEGKV